MALTSEEIVLKLVAGLFAAAGAANLAEIGGPSGSTLEELQGALLPPAFSKDSEPPQNFTARTEATCAAERQ